MQHPTNFRPQTSDFKPLVTFVKGSTRQAKDASGVSIPRQLLSITILPHEHL
jgi:hypothetical protein